MRTAQNIPAAPRLIRLPEVIQRTTFRKTKIYELIRQGKFPAPVRLGTRTVAWDQDSVDRWINERIADRG